MADVQTEPCDLRDLSVSQIVVSAVSRKPLLETTVVSRIYKKMSGELIGLILIVNKANRKALSAAENNIKKKIDAASFLFAPLLFLPRSFHLEVCIGILKTT